MPQGGRGVGLCPPCIKVIIMDLLLFVTMFFAGYFVACWLGRWIGCVGCLIGVALVYVGIGLSVQVLDWMGGKL